MSENPYSPPQTHEPVLQSPEPNLAGKLASRWERLGAAIIDLIILLICMIPASILIPLAVNHGDSGVTSNWVDLIDLSTASIIGDTAYSILSIILYVLINGYLLSKSGQTIGKKILNIQIVDYHTNQLLTPGKILGIRYGLAQLIATIPKVGDLLGLINILFIFGNEKRCIHDLMANSKVIKKSSL